MSNMSMTTKETKTECQMADALWDAVEEAMLADTRAEFLEGFAEASGCRARAVENQWAWFSRQLGDSARASEEAQGRTRGLELGREWGRLP